MTKSLAEFRKQKQQESEQKKSAFTNNNGNTFPHWKLEYGKSAQVRLLPNGDPEATAPWVTLKTIPTKFPDPDDNTKQVFFNVPCLEMYDPNERCPALAPVRELYKQAKALKKSGNTRSAIPLEQKAKEHWIDAKYYWNEFVLKSGFVEEGLSPELAGPAAIRTAMFTKQIQNKIMNDIGLPTATFGEAAEEDAPPPVLDNWPQGSFTADDIRLVLDENTSQEEVETITENLKGNVFYILKQKNGEFAKWDSSYFNIKERHELDIDQLTTIAEKGLPDLSKLLPPRPTEDQYEVLAEIVKKSIDGGDWNSDWEQFGFKFYRKKSTDGTEDTSSNTDTSLANNVAKTMSGNNSLAAAISRRKSATTAETSSENVSVEDEVKPETKLSDPKSVAAMLKARHQK